jgi:hypothetical protein
MSEDNNKSKSTKKDDVMSRLYPDSFYETVKAKITSKPAPAEPQPEGKKKEKSNV